MAQSKPSNSLDQALVSARQILEDLKDVSRWQTGLLDRLEKTLHSLTEPGKPKRPRPKT